MKLTKEEKDLLINAKDEVVWYSICDDIKYGSRLEIIGGAKCNFSLKSPSK